MCSGESATLWSIYFKLSMLNVFKDKFTVKISDNFLHAVMYLKKTSTILCHTLTRNKQNQTTSSIPINKILPKS